jgi:glycosyltransferase involved in cell wall biosynthesis
LERGIIKAAVVIPVFNHARSVKGVTEAVRAVLEAAGERLEFFVVDDGSRDGTAEVLAGVSGVTVLRHRRNRGKGAALWTGFVAARGVGCSHVITVDADGQHCPADVLTVLRAARAHVEDLIIGHRDMESAGDTVPLRSRKGRDAARFWLRVQTGQEIPDSQCGLRAYPLTSTLSVPHRFKRYDFETEILARLSWGGAKVRNVPVKCIYFAKEQRVSHFRPIRDTLRGVRVNVFLVARRLLPLPFRRLVTHDAVEGPVRLGSWWKWSTWKSAVKDALRAGSSNSELAMAFALGVFVGLTPLPLIQTILAIYFARRLHLNVLAAVIGSQISIPPLMPLWAGVFYAVGQLILTGEWVLSSTQQVPAQWTWSMNTLAGKAWPLVVGSLPVAIAMAVLSLVVVRLLLYCVRGQRVAVSASAGTDRV